MSVTIFASDIHLSPADKAGVIPFFLSFLKDRLEGASSLYLLGDIFDYWVGPGMLSEPGLEPVFSAIRDLTGAGVGVTLLHGNRDFLFGRREAKSLGVSNPGESVETALEGKRIFLTHGDLFCTRDLAYQRMKRILRNPLLKKLVRAMPRPMSNRLAHKLKSSTERSLKRKSPYETSIDLKSVQEVMDQGFDAVICGHFHETADEILEGGGRLITLSDWTSSQGSYAEFREGDLSLKLFPE